MSLNDPLSNAMSKMLNAEKATKNVCCIKPVSRIVKEILRIMNEEGYIGSSKEEVDGRGNFIKVDLLGRINKCGSIRPRYSVKKRQFERFEKRYLPAKDFGVLIVSAPQGIMTHKEAKKKGIGGKLIAYVY